MTTTMTKVSVTMKTKHDTKGQTPCENKDLVIAVIGSSHTVCCRVEELANELTWCDTVSLKKIDCYSDIERYYPMSRFSVSSEIQKVQISP